MLLIELTFYFSYTFLHSFCIFLHFVNILLHFLNTSDNFVHVFFSKCRAFIPSCSRVELDDNVAIPVLGCLFSRYPDLMTPIIKEETGNEI